MFGFFLMAVATPEMEGNRDRRTADIGGWWGMRKRLLEFSLDSHVPLSFCLYPPPPPTA